MCGVCCVVCEAGAPAVYTAAAAAGRIWVVLGVYDVSVTVHLQQQQQRQHGIQLQQMPRQLQQQQWCDQHTSTQLWWVLLMWRSAISTGSMLFVGPVKLWPFVLIEASILF
jgi:hypothetical protein